MALVTKLEQQTMTANRVHGPVNCTYSVFDEDGRRYLQIDTYGSAQRKIRGMKSQTIQLDEQTARQLKRLLDENF